MSALKGFVAIVGLAALFSVVGAFNGSHTPDSSTTPAAPKITEAEMLASSEIRCDSPAIWISRHDSSKTGKAQGFFIQIHKGKAKLYVFDIGSDTEGTLRFKGKVVKETVRGETFYSFSDKESEAQWQLTNGNLYDAIFTPQKGEYGYMITSTSSNGCSIAKVEEEAKK